MRFAARLRALGISLLVPVVLVVLWWVLSEDSTSAFYPSLSTILTNFRETWLFERFGSDVVPSLLRLGAGYLLAAAIGTALGILLGRVRVLHLAFQPAIQFARSIPATGLVPVSIVLLGIGDAPKIWLIAFVCVFPILLNTVDGVRSVEQGLEDVGQTFRLTRRQRIFAVHLPSAAPQIFAGLRISLAIAFIMMIVTEMLGATSGLGFVTLNAQQSFQIPLMWSGTILLGILGALLNALFVLVERRVLRWHYLSTGRAQ
ncbi:ABC transporter permease [Streptomyces sp. T028]|uniref:ABC transporter permease n=1 Tax=Streptomyces sp. T028 TaxID=3394379 RepID=UPI003A841C85